MDLKPHLNEDRYFDILRKMTPEARLRKAMELSDMTKKLFRQGLRNIYPELTETDFQKKYLERLKECHNQNY